MTIREKQKMAFEAPLHPLDTEDTTYGCRHTNPDICKSAYVPNKCAFSRDDNICYAPSIKWKKKYRELKKGNE